MNISIIAAVGKNGELGKNNELIWRFPDDMKFFRDTTTGHIIVMGRKTFESLPKILPNRKHIVFSSSDNFPLEVEVYKDVNEFLMSYSEYTKEIFVIGGAQIYKAFINLANKLYLTEIYDECSEADAYFPTFNKSEYDLDVIDENNEYRHVLYRRK